MIQLFVFIKYEQKEAKAKNEKRHDSVISAFKNKNVPLTSCSMLKEWNNKLRNL